MPPRRAEARDTSAQRCHLPPAAASPRASPPAPKKKKKKNSAIFLTGNKIRFQSEGGGSGGRSPTTQKPRAASVKEFEL